MDMLIIVCGLPGSGKTTLAKALSRRLGAAHLSSDRIRREIFPDPSYSEDEKKAVYIEMARRAGKGVLEGKNVIVDATFYKKWQRDLFLSPPGKKAVVLCMLDEEQARRRLARRKPGGVSDADYGVYLKLKEGFEPIEGDHLEIDSALPLKARIARIMDALK